MPIEAAMVATLAPSTNRLRHRARCSIGSAARDSTRHEQARRAPTSTSGGQRASATTAIPTTSMP